MCKFEVTTNVIIPMIANNCSITASSSKESRRTKGGTKDGMEDP
jgi:hypothetical protein